MPLRMPATAADYRRLARARLSDVCGGHAGVPPGSPLNGRKMA